MNTSYYNNLGIGVIALSSVLNQSNELSIPKLFLIFPLVSHLKLLRHLSRKTTKIISIEKLIVEKIEFFSNFNKRYIDSLVLTTNALQYLNDTGHVKILDGVVSLEKPLKYQKKMGNRAESIFNASKNISLILEEPPEKLYLNLRVEL